MLPRRPLPPAETPALPLNRSEWLYVACEGPMGQLNQTYLLQLDADIGVDELRAALRRMLTAFPRLRGVLEPTPRRFVLRVLADDDAVDLLLDSALKEERIDLADARAVARWHEQALNEPLAIRRGLGLRVQLARQAGRSAIILTVHHILIDGRSMVGCVQSLLTLLNGGAIDDEPLSSPSMLPAMLPASWRQWPGCLLAAWRAQQAQQAELQRHDIVRLPQRRRRQWLTTGVAHHDLGCRTADLSAEARRRGGSSNSLLMAAVGTALLEREAGQRMSGQPHAALIRVSVDLRRWFPDGQAPGMGNHVATLDLLLPEAVPEAERVRWLDQRLREGQERFQQRSMVLPLLPYEWLGLLASHTYDRLIRRGKRLDQLPRLSFHATNIGALDAFNTADARVKLQALYPAVSGAAPLGVFVAVGGRQFMVATHQRDEFHDADMADLTTRTRRVLARWLASTPDPVVSPHDGRAHLVTQ